MADRGAAVRPARPAWSRSRPRAELALAIVTAVLLVVDAVVHLRDAGFYAIPNDGLGEDTLFRLEGVVAIVVAVALLVRPHPITWALALLVAATAAAAVFLSTYVDLGPIGPIPDLYEPTWQVPGKVLSAVAEVLATVLAACGLWLSIRGRRRSRRRAMRT